MFQNSSLMEARYGAEVRHHQMKMGIGGEIKELVLQVMNDAVNPITESEIAKRIKPLLPEHVVKKLGRKPHYLTTFDVVDGALTSLYLDDGRVRKKEVYYLR